MEQYEGVIPEKGRFKFSLSQHLFAMILQLQLGRHYLHDQRCGQRFGVYDAIFDCKENIYKS